MIVAEAGVNHNGSPELALRLVDAAAEAGADAVKFQTFKADRLVTPTAPKAAYQIQATDKAESQYEMLGRLELSPETYSDLMAHCQKRNILFMSSPFDEESADFLEELGVAVFKVASGEITNLPFLAHVSRKGRPIIISTGMADLGEVETAVNTMKNVGNENIILLHCVSSYPADPADVNLLAMKTMRQAFDVPVGYSDHTLGI
ncbi:MAG: N-acetylneuraminate synthase family protein, partial [Anaerolineaceae bacterium]